MNALISLSPNSDSIARLQPSELGELSRSCFAVYRSRLISNVLHVAVASEDLLVATIYKMSRF